MSNGRNIPGNEQQIESLLPLSGNTKFFVLVECRFASSQKREHGVNRRTFVKNERVMLFLAEVFRLFNDAICRALRIWAAPRMGPQTLRG